MSERKKIHIIAEAGTNHNGSLLKAKSLADIARRAKADSVKFQLINTWGLYLPGKYPYGHYNIDDVIKTRLDGEMSDQEYADLAEYCKNSGIDFSASVFDENGLKLLASFSPPYIKIASCDLNNIRFLRQVAEYGIRMVISTGMSTLGDIENSLKEITKSGFNEIVLLHCVSIYPSMLEQTNLQFISTLISEFGFEVGFSDHTSTSHAACMALCLGASWFEKHFTENKTQKGLDHSHALEENELVNYIGDLHRANDSLTVSEEKISGSEFYTRKRARRSLYAAKDLKAGHVLTNEDILCVRPENIMQADEIDFVVGKKLTADLKQYQPFSKELLK